MVAAALMMADQKGKNMTNLKIEGNKIYTVSTLCDKTDVFEIIEKIPTGFLFGILARTWERMNIFQLANTRSRETKKILKSTRTR